MSWRPGSDQKSEASLDYIFSLSENIEKEKRSNEPNTKQTTSKVLGINLTLLTIVLTYDPNTWIKEEDCQIRL
jgi:hypothetical protein